MNNNYLFQLQNDHTKLIQSTHLFEKEKKEYFNKGDSWQQGCEKHAYPETKTTTIFYNS